MNSPACDGPRPVDLRCEYMENPLGIDMIAPRLSWIMTSGKRGRRQTAYRVLAAGSEALLQCGDGDLWDTGKVLSDQSVHVPYAGRPLSSRRRCYWKVRVWDERGEAGPWSEISYWEMGLLEPSDWRAQWIGAPESYTPQGSATAPSPLFRREFALARPVESARVYLCGLGYYELHLNGRKVGDHVLDPGFTRYDKRALYVSYDVADYLQAGANAIGVMLGNGWYNQHAADVWNFQTAPWRDRPKLILQLHIRFTDGGETVLTSDPSWQCAAGPIIGNGVRNGETYDARLERTGWDLPGYEASAWIPASVVAGPGGMLAAQSMPPVRVTRTLAPDAVREVEPGVFVFDFGQNIAGWARLSVSGPSGTKVVLRYAEKLRANGDIDRSNIDMYVKSGDFQTDAYILKGEGTEEVWEPRFTYHGFRYVRVTGFPGVPTLENLRGRVVGTSFATAGEFSCGNELLNKIQACTLWSFRGNFVGIPTDCPHREKNGWTGDAHLAAEQALFNFATAPAYTKWMDDFADAQRPSGQLPGIVPTGGWGYNWGSGPAWDSAYFHIPWYVHLYCGDSGLFAAHYDRLRLYIDFVTSMATGCIVSFGLGDWCPPGKDPDGHKSPTALTSTGYYYRDCVLLAEMASVLDKKEDAAYFAGLAARIKAAFNERFYDRDTGCYADGDQTSQACALYQGLVERGEEAKVLARLVAAIEENGGRPDFGILGAKYVLHALTEYGRADTAYALATQTAYPGWGHWLAQGATTLWEDWQGDNSRNHIMFGDISAWFYRALAGINPDPSCPGFKRVIIRPRPVPGLAWVRAWHDSPYGRIESAWRCEGGSFRLSLRIPANATAAVYLPAGDPGAVTESGAPATHAQGVIFLRAERGETLWTVGAGEYRFEMPWVGL